jgi:hypothetical protein
VSDQTSEELTAEAVAEAVGGVPVVRLHERSAAGTHLAGRRVHGVRVHGQDVEVHVATVWPTTVAEAADAVRAALAPLPIGTVDVTIDDIVLPDDDDSPERSATEDTP